MIFCYGDTPTCEIHTLSLHDALPILVDDINEADAVHDETAARAVGRRRQMHRRVERSEEHTSELQSRENLVCRLLLEKKKHESKRKLLYRHKGQRRGQTQGSR